MDDWEKVFQVEKLCHSSLKNSSFEGWKNQSIRFRISLYKNFENTMRGIDEARYRQSMKKNWAYYCLFKVPNK